MNDFPGINLESFKIVLDYKDFCNRSILQYNNTKLLILKNNSILNKNKSKEMLKILKKLKIKSKDCYLIKFNK